MGTILGKNAVRGEVAVEVGVEVEREGEVEAGVGFRVVVRSCWRFGELYSLGDCGAITGCVG